MREYVNPFQTYKSFGKERRERVVGKLATKHNQPWPAPQLPDPIVLPSLGKILPERPESPVPTDVIRCAGVRDGTRIRNRTSTNAS